MVSTRSSSFRKKARRVLSLIYTPRKLLSSNFFPFAFLILDEPSRIHIQNEKVGGRNQFSISNVFYGSLISKHWFNLKGRVGFLLLLVVVELKFRNESVLLFQKMLWCTAYEILFAFLKMKLIWKHMFAQNFEISFRKTIFLFGFHQA